MDDESMDLLPVFRLELSLQKEVTALITEDWKGPS